MKTAYPNRLRHSYTQILIKSPDQVFPLLCPIRELEWAEGWNPSLVVSNSGVVEKDCVFITPGDSEDTIWVVTRHDAEQLELEMLMVTPGRTVGKLEISLLDLGGNKTAAEVAYTHTSLGPEGDEYMGGLTEEWYLQFMQDWETQLNHFLSTH